jgi:hypothetical protein
MAIGEAYLELEDWRLEGHGAAGAVKLGLFDPHFELHYRGGDLHGHHCAGSGGSSVSCFTSRMGNSTHGFLVFCS